jgi:hypothetical protein
VSGYENTAFGKKAMKAEQQVEKAIANNTVDDSKWRSHKAKMKCNKCKKQGHFARDCRTPQHVIDRMKGKSEQNSQARGDTKMSQSSTQCEFCDKPGHRTKDCFHMKRMKKQFKNTKRGADSYMDRHQSQKRRVDNRLTIRDSDEESNVLIEEVNAAENDTEQIYLDCGCNKMVLNSTKSMRNLRHERREMSTANKGKLKISAIGDAGIHKNVYFAPEASKNLVDMKSITSRGYTVLFDNDEVIIRNKKTNHAEVLRQKSVNGLYAIDIDKILYLDEDLQVAATEECIAESTEEQDALWHKRLGHVHYDKLVECDRRGLVEGVNLDKKYFRKRHRGKRCKCNICMRAKLTRKSFKTPKARLNMDGPQEKGKITADTMELLNTASMEGYKHVLAFKHSDSKKMWIYGMKTKSGEEVLECIKNLVEVKLPQDGITMNRYHADGAGELIGKHVRTYLRENITTQRTKVSWTPSDTPELNSVSERANRTTKEMALAMLLDSGLPATFWFKALSHAVYIINRLPTKTDKGYISPYEYINTVAPDVSDLKIWGCKAWAIVPKDRQRKEWKDKGKPGYYMGISTQPIGHQIYIPDMDQVITTVHAAFDENIPSRSSQYYEEIDNLDIKVSNKVEKVENFKYLIGLQHMDGLIPYVTTRVVERRGMIVGYRKHATGNSQIEEQTPIHIRDIEQMTHDTANNSMDYQRLQAEVEGLPSTPHVHSNSENAISSMGDKTTETENPRKRKKRNLINVGVLGDTSLFLGSSIDITEPKTLKEAKKTKFRTYWIEATRKEIHKLEQRNCWKIVRKPKNRKLIKSKLVYKVKRDYLGRIKKFKARLVAKGFTQEEGIDFKETFSPVAKGVSFRMALAIALKYQMQIRQLDVETAFPYADLKEEVYMTPPDGIDIPDGHCMKIEKSLYGLKQAPRNWHNMLKESILAMGYTQCALDQCLFYKRDSDKLHIMLVYVDDIIVLSSDATHVQDVIQKFNEQYVMEDLGTLKHYLGITIDIHDDHIKLHQRSYAKEVISRFNHLISDKKRKNDVKTPLPPGIKLTKESSTSETVKQREYTKNFPYQSVIGAIMYLAVHTRPDLAYTVNLLSRFNSKPTYAACQAALHTLVYIEGTLEVGIIFPNRSDCESLLADSDADWAGDFDTSRSTTGYIVYLWGAAIAWQSRLQPTVATSTMEAEYMAAYGAIQEIVWIRGVMTELGIKEFELSGKAAPTTLNMDSKSAIDLAQNPINHKRSKHIRIKYHWVREQVGAKIIKLQHVISTDMRADMMTKSLADKLHDKHMKSVVR